MSSSLEKLLSSASSSLSDHEPALTDQLRSLAGLLADKLLSMLRERNGFYALESALHVFPSHLLLAVEIRVNLAADTRKYSLSRKWFNPSA